MAKFSKAQEAQITVRLAEMADWNKKELDAYISKTMYSRQGHAAALEIDREALKRLMVSRDLLFIETAGTEKNPGKTIKLTIKKGYARPNWEAIAKELAGDKDITDLIAKHTTEPTEILALSKIV